jgi:hypothetical protein
MVLRPKSTDHSSFKAKLLVNEKNSPPFTETEESLPYLKQPVNESYPELEKSSQHTVRL